MPLEGLLRLREATQSIPTTQNWASSPQEELNLFPQVPDSVAMPLGRRPGPLLELRPAIIEGIISRICLLLYFLPATCLMVIFLARKLTKWVSIQSVMYRPGLLIWPRHEAKTSSQLVTPWLDPSGASSSFRFLQYNTYATCLAIRTELLRIITL